MRNLFQNKFNEDILLRVGNKNIIIRATNELLQDLVPRLEDPEKPLSDFRFSEPESTETELEKARMKYDTKV